MSAVILGTQMDSGHIKWRPETSNVKGYGPDDKTLVVKFTGDPAALPGFDGTTLNIAQLREACGLAQQDWIPNEGVFQCTVEIGKPTSVTVAFDQ